LAAEFGKPVGKEEPQADGRHSNPPKLEQRFAPGRGPAFLRSQQHHVQK
jgi:hypothetical protein